MKKIAIHSVPRSGSSWVGQIFNSSPNVNFKFQPLFSYAFKGNLNTSSSYSDIDVFFNLIAKSRDDFLLQQDKIDQGIYPAFNKNKKFTHIIYKEVRYNNIIEHMMKIAPDVLVIGVVRSPYSVINSFLSAPREFRKDFGWKELEEWRFARKKNLGKAEEFYGFEKWKDVVFLFRELKRKYPDKFYFLKYDDLILDANKEVGKLFEFCNIEMSNQTMNFLIKCKQAGKDGIYSVYNSKTSDDGWRESLNPIIIAEISRDLEDNNLIEYLLKI